MNNIDVLLSQYNLTRYKISQNVPSATKQRLSDTNKKPVENYKTDIIIALAEGITQSSNIAITPGQVLDTLIKIQNNRKEEIKMDKIIELQKDLEKGMNGASITIWENKEEIFDTLRTNNDPNVDWAEVLKSEFEQFDDTEKIVECNNGNGEPCYFGIESYEEIYGYFR